MSSRPIVTIDDMEWLAGRPPRPAVTTDDARTVHEVAVRQTRVHAASWFRGRKGYDPKFIAGLRVPLPTVGGAMKGDESPLLDRSGHVLAYAHFSSVLSKSRRLPFFTAVNIDGKATVKVKRGDDTWFLDGRIALEHQAGEELYEDNILDRGHLVRREDPNWGEAARLANDDTFHFTNCAPQAGAFNQRTWLGLEDYILRNADVFDLRVNVFTGPVFRKDDRLYRKVRIPREFWKVVAIRTPERPSATAYLLSQSNQLGNLEFAFGRYKTFQVAIREVESLTGLSFGELSRYDGFSNTKALLAARTPRVELNDWKQIRI